MTNSTTIVSSTRSSFQVGHVRTLFTHSDLSGLEDTPQFFWDVFTPGRAIYSQPLGSTDRILNILQIKYRCGRSRTQSWRGQTNVNKPHSFGWHCPSPVYCTSMTSPAVIGHHQTCLARCRHGHWSLPRLPVPPKRQVIGHQSLWGWALSPISGAYLNSVKIFALCLRNTVN